MGKRRKIVPPKMRVRLCLKDIYRYIVTGLAEPIEGISRWTASEKGLSITYENGRHKDYKALTELERKQALKIINKYVSEVH